MLYRSAKKKEIVKERNNGFRLGNSLAKAV